MKEEEKTLEEEDTKIKQLEEEVQQFRDKYLHQLAEMENARKRLQKERGDMTRFAIENVLLEFLAPLDSFENAISFTDQMSDEIKNWAIGFQMILNQLKDILKNHNVSAFESLGEVFDPHRHEAVEVLETDEHEEGIILQEFVRGYMCGNRVLRPARVKVARKPKQVTEEINHKEKPNDPEEEK